MRFKSVIRASLLSILVLATAAEAGWFHATSAVYQARTDTEKHASTISQMVYVRDVIRRPSICIVYNNAFTKDDDGRVVSVARVLRSDLGQMKQVQTVSFAGGVKNNSYMNCKTGPKLQPRDVVLFEHEFKGFPRVREVAGGRDFFEVTGVVSAIGEPSIENAPNGLALAKGDSPLGLVPVEKGGWYFAQNSIYQAQEDKEKHPKRTVVTMVVPRDAGRPVFCAGLTNNSEEPRRGRIVTDITVTRNDEQIRRVNLAGGMRDNAYLGCKGGGRILAGDIVRFDFEFLNMPRLEKSGDVVGYSDVHAVISPVGAPVFRTPPPPPPPPPPPAPTNDPPPPPTNNPPPPPPPPGNNPPPPPPPGGGGLSGADLACISSVLYTGGAGSRQIVRPKGNRGGRVEVFGPRSQVANGAAVPSTLGFGSTYAAACADYERKLGSVGPPGPNIAADAALWAWYFNMNSSAGPTAVRKDPRGGFHADVYRPHLGVVILSASSPADAIRKLQRLGL